MTHEMTFKHNKKRNTAFIYETLICELTKATISNDSFKKKHIITLIKESFAKNTLLRKDLDFYTSLVDTTGAVIFTADKLLKEVLNQRTKLNKKNLFEEQSVAIAKINKTLGHGIWSNFVPNYKSLATIYQIFNNNSLAPKQKVILEESILKHMTVHNPTTKTKPSEESIDHVVVNKFINKFNKTYENIHQEQKVLLQNYVFSFIDDSVSLKTFLNEELGRLKSELQKALKKSEIVEDKTVYQNTKQVISHIDQYSNQKITENMIEEVLKIQTLVREINE